MAEHVRVGSVDAYSSLLGEAPQSPCRGMPIHPGSTAVEQNGAVRPVGDCSVDGAADCWGQRDHDGVALGGPAMARIARDYGYTLAELRKL
jgi:hypothetical protein